MSKITFRADDDLVDELEALEISKSEAMREALRSYLGADAPAERETAREETDLGAIDDLVRQRVDELLDERIRELERERREDTRTRDHPNEVTVSVSLGEETRERERPAAGRERDRERTPDERVTRRSRDARSDASREPADTEQPSDEDAHDQCGQCGEPVDDDHVYCPNCGEKASRRLFCDCGDEIRSDWSFCPGCGRRTPAADVLGRDTPS